MADISMLDALGQREYELEVEATDMGIQRYREIRQNVPAGDWTPEQKFIVEGMDTLVPALDEIAEMIQNGTAMPRLTKWAVPFLTVPTDKMALITLWTLFNNQAQSYEDSTHAALIYSVARAVQLEVQFMELKEQPNHLFEKLSRRVKSWNRNKRAIQWARREAQLCNKPWTTEICMALGWVLVNTAIEHTKLFTYERRWYKGKSFTKVVLDGVVKDSIEKQHEDMEILRPFCYPMVVPPKPWSWSEESGLETGGYLYMATPLLKQGISHASEEGGDLDYVCRSLNILQRVPWQINKRVLDVATVLWRTGGGRAGLPEAEPKHPRQITEEERRDPAKNREYRDMAKAIFDENAREASRRVATQMVLDLSRKFAGYSAVYMPHQLDFRGRAYPLPSLLHPQGEDLSRGLLRFAEGKPLGSHGYRQLTIHLANCIGFDKETHDERVRLVEGMAGSIVEWAEDPLANRGWMDTDDPFQSLAASFEWADARHDPEGFVSRTPCAIDGSCNGLQHLSALGRDPIGGAAVNLLPSETPADIYTDVCSVVIRDIESDTLVTPRTTQDDDGVPYVSPCWVWRGNVTRTTVKRAVMTTPYGLTQYGMRDQFYEDGHLRDLEGIASENARYLADKVEKAISEVVVKAAQIMGWLQDCANIAGKEGYYLTWWVPTGMDVTQNYRVLRSKRLKTSVGEVYYKKRTPRLSVGKQVSGIAPNYIHSLDAAHMMLTTLNATGRGVSALAMIHDSYATHACDIPLLHAVTRETFVDIHDRNILEDLHTEWCERTGLDLPLPPPQGDLSIPEVMRSEYFFH